MAHHETEMKYLITMPDAGMLAKQEGCEVWEIEQIYLTAEKGQIQVRVDRSGAMTVQSMF